MLPIIYTTYGIAMRHRPEELAASGGLRLAGTERRREPTARLGEARLRCWIETVLVCIHLRQQAVDSPTAGAARMAAAVLPASR
jgi:hypothetical protein